MSKLTTLFFILSLSLLIRWLLIVFVGRSLIAGSIHMFTADGGAQSIASITLDQVETLASPLNYHDGYWVTEIQIPNRPLKMKIIDDTFCFHPNAVYLNGSGEELREADGTGEWWVKHAWILGGEGYDIGGEGYDNCELHPQAEYNDCFWVEGVLLDDGLSMKVGAVEFGQEGFYNIRTPPLDEDPIAYQVTRFAPKNTDPEAGEVDLTPTEQFVLAWDCVEEVSAFDSQMRGCPQIQN